MQATLRIAETVARLSKAASGTLLLMALAIVAGEWVWRQLTGSNVLLGWMELACYTGALAAAAALAAVRFEPAPPGRPQPGREPRNLLLALAAASLFVVLVLFLAMDAFAGGRSHYTGIPLAAMFATMAFFVLAWLLSVGFGHGRAPPAGAVAAPPAGESIWPASLATAGMLLLSSTSHPLERPASLISQMLWGLLSQELFLTFVFAVCLIEMLGALPDRGGSRGNPGTAINGGDVLGGRLRHATSTDDALWAAGLVSPLSAITLMLSLFLGLRSSETAAAMFLPACAGSVVSVAIAITRYRRRAAGAEGATWRPASGLAVVPVAALIVVVPVLLGYARFVESVAVLTVCVGVVTMRTLGTSADVWRLASGIVFRLGFSALYVLAGGCAYLAGDRLGVRAFVADAVAGYDMSLVAVVAVGSLAAAALLRRLSPLNAALLLLPIYPGALDAAGADVFQTLVLYVGSIATGGFVLGFVLGADRAVSRPSFALALGCMALMLVAAFPGFLSHLAIQGRFW